MENENNDPIKNVGVKKEEVKEAKVVDNNSSEGTINNTQMNIFALLSFIFAMIGLIVAGIPCGILAIVLGIIGLVTISKKPFNNKWMAITGLVVGILDIIAVGVFLSRIL